MERPSLAPTTQEVSLLLSHNSFFCSLPLDLAIICCLRLREVLLLFILGKKDNATIFPPHSMRLHHLLWVRMTDMIANTIRHSFSFFPIILLGGFLSRNNSSLGAKKCVLQIHTFLLFLYYRICYFWQDYQVIFTNYLSPITRTWKSQAILRTQRQ